MSKSIDDVINKICVLKVESENDVKETKASFEHLVSENWEDFTERRTGKTTRCVDQAIQILFKTGSLTLVYSGSHGDIIEPDSIISNSVQKLFIAKVENRLKSEHLNNYIAIRTYDSVVFNIKKE